VETVPVEAAVAGLAPEVSQGEAMVVYATDSYATAMITKQFDVIRIGTLMKTKEPGNGIKPNHPFEDLLPGPSASSRDKPEEIPNLNESVPDKTLPEPGRSAPAAPPLSELDALEQSNQFKALTQDEKNKLGKLSRQEKLTGEEEEEAPPTAPVSNSFPQNAKKKQAQKPKATDEEELNQLMMQN
jgi:hypothetical protein